MREVKAVKINTVDFAPYGTYCNMTEPEGYPLEGEIHKFYPDRISGTCIGSMAFSPIEVRKDERIVKAAEYHTTTWEGIVALDDDMLIHVAPASGDTPVPELAKKEAEELKNMDFQTAWTHTLKNAEFATSFVELLQEMLTGMDADDVIVSIDDLVDSVGGN